jgi:hypothetical protein
MRTNLTTTEAALMAALLRPRVETLGELLAAQVQGLPAGDDTWADTEDELNTAERLLRKVEAIR